MHGINACSATNAQKEKESALLQALLHEERLMEVLRHASDDTDHPGFSVLVTFQLGVTRCSCIPNESSSHLQRLSDM
jgi:hypothetical protein